MRKEYPTKPRTDELNQTKCVTDRPYNPIESLEKEIQILKEEVQGLKFELLDCYRRLDN